MQLAGKSDDGLVEVDTNLNADVDTSESLMDGEYDEDETNVTPGKENKKELKPPSSFQVTGKSKKRKVAEEDKCMAIMGEYFAQKLSGKMPQSSESRAVSDDKELTPVDEDEMFGKLLATEIKKVPEGGIKRRLKQQLLNDCYKAQEEAEMQPQMQQQQQQVSWMLFPTTGNSTLTSQTETVANAELLLQLQHLQPN